MLKNISDKITQEQKESIFDFVADWIKSGKDVILKDKKVEGYYFNFNNVKYDVFTSVFDDHQLCGISIINNIKDFMIIVLSQEIKNKENIKVINDFLIQNNVETIINDDEFSEITNIFVDKSKLRSKKINRIKNNI